MSIEAKPQLSTEEVNNQIGQMERSLAHPDRSSLIAALVEDITTNVVPSSLEKAEQIAAGLTEVDKSVRTDIRKNPAIRAEMDEDVIDDLHATARKGVDNWRLSKDERSEFGQVVGVKNPKHLTPRMKSLMGKIGTEELTPTEQLAALKKQARDRLALDEAIEAKYGAANAKRKMLPEVEGDASYDQSIYKNGAKHIYVSGADGKKRHVSADDILAAYGHAGDTQGKRPKAVVEIPVTEVSESTPVETFVRPDDFPQDEWDKLSSEGMKVVMGVAAKEAAEAANEAATTPELVMPEDFGNVDVWNSLSDDQKRVVLNVELAEKAKEVAAKTEGVQPVTANQAAWDRIQKRIEARVATENAKKTVEAAEAESKKQEADKLAMPTDYGNVARWNTFSDAQKATVIAAIAKREAAEAEVNKLQAVETANEPEVRKARSGKRMIAAVVAGALLLGTVAGRFAVMDNETPARAATTHAKEVEKPAKRVAAVKHASKEGPATVHMKRGDTIWNEAEIVLARQGVNHPSDAKIDKEADHLRAINGHMSEAKAEKLPVGFTLKLR